ncbi:hypothetical protein Tco_1243730 [Tanacetum coccineum]
MAEQSRIFFSPVGMVPVIALAGFSLFDRGFLVHYLIVFKLLCCGRPPDTPYPPVGYDVSTLLLRQRIDCCSLNNVSILPNNMAYFENSIRRNRLTEKGITMAKSILDKSRVEQNLVEPKTDWDVKYELSKELLTELNNNTYYGRFEEDVIDHIVKFLEILDLIKIANVGPFQFHIRFFPLSLAGDARKWWMNEGNSQINTWEGIVIKKFEKFYPLSCASNYDQMCDDDEECQVGRNEGLLDDIVLSDEEWEEHEYGNLPNIVVDSSPKPYLNAHHEGDGSNHEKWNGNTKELGKEPHPNNVCNIERMCKTKKFEVIKYSLGPTKNTLL